MSYRVTRKELEEKVKLLNNKAKVGAGSLGLNYAACYGGYCLTDYHGSHHVTPRMSAKEMDQYLNGALDWV
jgi:hypothetical protein